MLRAVLGFLRALGRRLARLWRVGSAPQTARRRALAAAAGALAGLAAFAARLPRVFGKHAAAPKSGHSWGMAIDLDRCSACGACTIACRQENNVPAMGPGDENRGAHLEWMSMLWLDPKTTGGLPEVLPFPCQHCERAPCTQVCPVGATYKDPEGITAQIWSRCIGCRYCMVACPYGRRSFNWTEPQWDGSLIQLLNPDVATRPRGVVEKCTFCHHRIQNLKEEAKLQGRKPTDEELKHLTACATACPTRAIVFGDLNDPQSSVAKLSRSPRAFRLLEHLGTRPKVVYLKRDRRS
jgi:molybdopterin-containing oxidoreductase family iron-sulfur binding subunit